MVKSMMAGIKKIHYSCAKEFGSFIPDVDHLKNKLSITNITMVIKQITVDSKNLNFYGGSIK
jgi:hypothetical protein